MKSLIFFRLNQLEEKVRSREHGDLLLAPSHYLMQGYSKASVDDAEQQQPQQKGPEEALLEQVRERLSSSEQQADDAARSLPEMAELYRKFRALSTEEEVSASSSGEVAELTVGAPPEEAQVRLDPPDLIAEGVAKYRENTLSITEEEEEEEEMVEDPIVLPPHLQSLVDKAMKDLLADSQ